MSQNEPIAASAGVAALGQHSVRRIGYGAMQLRNCASDPARAVALLQRAMALGVDHLDTAEFYGNGFVNAVIREAVRPSDRMTIATKIGGDPDPTGKLPIKLAQRPEQLRASVEANLAALKVDHLALVNLRRAEAGHGLDVPEDQQVNFDDQLATMVAMREEGKIGEIGLSAVNLDHLRRASSAGIACVQNAYSLVSRQGEPLLDYCREQGIAWVPFFPLGGAMPGLPKVVDRPEVIEAARLAGATPSQVGLAWLLHHAPNILLIPGTSKLEHLEENVATGTIALDRESLAILDAVAIGE